MSLSDTRQIRDEIRERVAARVALMHGKHTVVSMFSGCGGLDLGFVGGFAFGGKYYVRMPYKIIWANDINKAVCRTYKANIESNIHAGDIATVKRSMPDSADVIIGGFPCQDVSINGKKKGSAGKRSVLYRHMVKAIVKLQPRVFVAENVNVLLQTHGRAFFERMLADFESTGYNVSHQLYLAADYGVPQMRKRVFIVGVRDDRPFEHPQALHHDHVSAKEALEDLERWPYFKPFGHIWSKAAASPEQGSRKLAADKPSTTIRAEHHGNVQWHYKLGRRISLREAARLQSFPDSFTFTEGMRETERQIGNAVPPVLAWHIAKAVRNYLDPD